MSESLEDSIFLEGHIPTLDIVHCFAVLFAYFLLVSYSVLELCLLLVC